jgi:hypothetical protein
MTIEMYDFVAIVGAGEGLIIHAMRGLQILKMQQRAPGQASLLPIRVCCVDEISHIVSSFWFRGYSP